MSALEPVILNEVTKLAKAISSQTDTVLLDIPFRAGHSFVEGDIALYDTERGDLHDGRGEIIEYFSPASNGAGWVAKSEQAVAVDERADGSLFVAALFRDSSRPEGTTSTSENCSLEVGFRAAGGQFVYAKAYLPTYNLGFSLRDMRLIPVSPDEYFLVFSSLYSSGRSVQVCSVRVGTGSPVIGAFTSANDGNFSSLSNNPLFLVGIGKLVVFVPDSSAPKAYIYSSVDGVISFVAASGLPVHAGAFQIDSKRILIPALSKMYQLSSGGSPEVVDVVLDMTEFVSSPSYSGASAFSLVSQGYAEGSDILHGVFCPRTLADGGRVYVSGVTIGGFTVSGINVKVHAPFSEGSIGYDCIFYKAALPNTAVHPIKAAGGVVAGSYAFPASYFIKRGLFASCSTNKSIASYSGFTRTAVRGKYIDGGVIIARQSGRPAIAPIGAGGKVIAFKHNALLAAKTSFVSVGDSGLLPFFTVSKGRLRFPDAAVNLTSYNARTVSNLSALRGPVVVNFLGLNQTLQSPGVKLWVCEDGVWSVQKVSKPASTLDPIAPSLACVAVTYFWDDIRPSSGYILSIEVLDGVVE